MVKRDSEIVLKILSMTEAERAIFMSGLKPDTLVYLDVLLAKAEAGINTSKLKHYLDSKG